jgi:hypothetical protein
VHETDHSEDAGHYRTAPVGWLNTACQTRALRLSLRQHRACPAWEKWISPLSGER